MAGAVVSFIEDVLRQHLSLPIDSCIPWPFGKDKDGYPLGKINGKTVRVSKYICTRAHGEAPEGTQAAHSCHNRPCINPEHLSWMTNLQNMAGLIENGTGGEDHPNAKLNNEIAREIKIALRDKKATLDGLAAKYGVSRNAIWQVKEGITYQTVIV